MNLTKWEWACLAAIVTAWGGTVFVTMYVAFDVALELLR